MPWYFPWSDSIKKRACRYLLQHYLGQFLQEKLTLDQLTVDLFNGKGIVKRVPLDVWALNELLEGANVPLEILDGFIDTIAISVPWSSLMQDNCELEVKGLEIVVGIKKDVDYACSVTSESLLFSSMTTSLELAQGCLKGDESPPNEQTTPTQQTFEGLESFAQTIESVLSRIKVSFQDVMIRFEHLVPNKKSGIGLELHLQRIDYSDLSSDVSQGADEASYEPPSLAHKCLRIFGVKLSLDEFCESSRTLLRDTLFKDESLPSESPAPSPPLSPSQSSTENHHNLLSLLPAVVILESAGQQEAKVKWKLNSSCPGPKVEFEYFIGTLNILVSPKQLHLLLELMNDINNLQNSDLCSYSHSEGLVNKPMKADDFHKIEKELHEQMLNQRKHEIPPGKIDLWDVCFDGNLKSLGSDKVFDGTTEEETFYSMTEEVQKVLPLYGPSVNGFPNTQGLVQKVSEAGILPLDNQDRGAPLSKFTIANPGLAGISGLDGGINNTTKGIFKLSGLSITLLLKDPVHLPGYSTLKSETSQDHPLCKTADRFFDKISSAAFGSKDLDQMQEKYNNACFHSHLRCFFATVKICCEISNTSSCQSLTTEATVGLLKLVECLVESNDEIKDMSQHHLTQLLKLSERAEHQLHSLERSRVSTSSCLKAKYKSIQRSCSPASIQGRHSIIPKTEIDIQLGDAELELDITLIERLHDILIPSFEHEAQKQPPLQHFTSYGGIKSDIKQQALFSRTMNDGSSCDQKINIQLTCPNISASLRFPVPDLRRPEHRQINSTWKKTLRKEVCVLECTEVAFETTLQDSEKVTSYEVRFKNLNGYLQLNDKNEPIPFLYVGQRHADSDTDGFDLPRIIFHVQSSVSQLLLEEASSGNDSPDSLSDTCPMLKSEPSPFSSKPVMHNEEELVVPGDSSEMKVFQEKASSSSKLHLEINFPEIQINLHDQSFFEMIYNRFGNDLLLWEPFDSSVVNKPELDVRVNNMIGVDFAPRMTQGRFPQDNFKMCYSMVNNESYSSDEDDSDSSSQRKTLHTIQETPKSTVAVTLNTSKARVVLFTHTKNDGEGDFGKIMLHFDNAELFYVLDYKGKLNLCYTSIQANNCALHHALVVDTVDENMDTVFDSGDFYRTIHESERGLKVTKNKSNVGERQQMFVLAVKCFLDTERNSKEFVVAISLCGATLRHRMVHEGQMWLMQMIDFFCVTDEEILGYVPPVVVTMLHVHFWNCAVHYRPLYIPYQLLVTAEGFSVCTNIIVDSKTSILRFIIDNAVLLISNNKEETMDLMKDYVSMVDVDLFELSLHTVNDVQKTSPKMSLTLSNNIVHIRTCSDSLSALLEIIRYVETDGDFQKDITPLPETNSTDDKKDESFNDCPVEQRNPEDGSLHDLMSEAMVESNTRDNNDCLTDEATEELKPSTSPQLDVFIFPGDLSVMTSEHEECNGTASADHSIEDDRDDSDDEFCILDHPQKEQEVIYDEPKVKSFGNEIKIVSDHFSVPVGGVDQLKAPGNYPCPVYCYTVKEMSVNWQLYGGRDFDENKNGEKRHECDDGVENGTEEDEMDEEPVIIDIRGSKKKKVLQPRGSWKSNAGVARDINTLVEVQLTKIRFQYEEYPEDAKQAWRQVLLIQDVEIRDRLFSSQINKLLYQYSTEARPKQTHANMVSIKLLGLRPDLMLKSQEGCLRISLKPLRLNIDQDTLQFLITFCKDLSNADEIANEDPCFESPLTEVSSTSDLPVTPNPAEQSTTNTPPIFFRLFEFSPEVLIRLDYHGKHTDMGQRSLAGLLFAFAQLNCSEIRLRRLCQRSGLLGFDRVISYALNEWASDIKKTQIPGILGGIGPTYSFVQLVQGVKDLFWLPVEQYRRDGRIIRGLQRGASSFTTSSAMAFLELTNKLVQVVHGAAEVAYDMVSPSTSSHGQVIKRRVSHQPADFRQGVANAYNVVTEGFGQTANTIVQVAMEEHENKGMVGAVGGVLRHIPSVVVQPIVLATEATSNVLGGVRNQILPDARREATEKWRLDER